MRKRNLIAAISGVCLLFACKAVAGQPDIATLDWSVKAPHNLAANPPSLDAILNFTSELEGGPGYPIGICYARGCHYIIWSNR